MGVCFCEISSTLFASICANQELLETLYEAVLSRIAAQLRFSELPTKKLFISYLNSAEIWYFEVYQSVLPVPQGSTDFSKICGVFTGYYSARMNSSNCRDLSDDYHYFADSIPDCLLTILDKHPERLVGY